ncbi:HlyD family secretion protein [Prochlorococcus marinus]|uniref:Putative transporter component n=1 Tax=Prochlorococcus marinus str. PAC1 TaxID=59924 RepID=A0A0A2C691_PROMR|nr:HlyD family efflux transporter periplasmic adaptor subunit [Prochlorococcus marinus]KGG21886.1 putative transporter component [Prochlorococcus marinus str. PAC1]
MKKYNLKKLLKFKINTLELKDQLKNIYFLSINKITNSSNANLVIIWKKAQDYLEKKFNRQERNENLIKQSNTWIQSVTWLLIGTSSFAIIWLCFAKTEEIVVASGRLEPKGNVHQIRIPSGGVAEEILVKAGDKVITGQILIQLDPESAKQQVLSLTEQIKEVKSQLNQYDMRLKIDNEILEKYNSLVGEGAISKLQYLQQLGQVEQIKTQKASTRANLSQLTSRLTDAKVNLKYKSLRSPVNGVVFDLKPTSKGFVAQTSEPVLKIVPYDELEADIEIPSNKIGFVRLGMPAEISIDSFPASDFGVLEGNVYTIGSDALAPNQTELRPEYRFPATIKLDSQTLRLKNGRQLPLQVGMSLTANIKLRNVTYIQLLLNQFKNKTDSLKEL